MKGMFLVCQHSDLCIVVGMARTQALAMITAWSRDRSRHAGLVEEIKFLKIDRSQKGITESGQSQPNCSCWDEPTYGLFVFFNALPLM